jgi:hypothetical protein
MIWMRKKQRILLIASAVAARWQRLRSITILNGRGKMLSGMIKKFGMAVVLLAVIYMAVLVGVWAGFEFAMWQEGGKHAAHKARCSSNESTERFTARDEFNAPVCVEKSLNTKQIRVVRLVYAEEN